MAAGGVRDHVLEFERRRGEERDSPPLWRRLSLYAVFEHTADLGLRITAADLDGLFEDAARGLFSLIVENLDDVRADRTVGFRLEERDRRFLLLDWLNEL